MAFTIWLLIIGIGLGVLVGAFAALSGTGGGALNVPIFTLVLLLPIDIAVGTSLLVMFFNSISTNYAYFKQKRVDYKTGAIMLGASLPMSIVGSLMTGLVTDSFAEGERIMTVVFYIGLFIISLVILFKGKGNGLSEKEFACDSRWCIQRILIDRDGVKFEYAFNWVKVLPIAGLAGFVSGFLGLGGGVIQVPMLYGVCGMPMHVTVATSGFIILFNAITGVTTKLFMNDTDLVVGLIFAAGTIIGAQLGAKIAKGSKSQRLKIIISVCLMGLSVFKILSFFFSF
nr:sulfite exporter TauE/SafE family protein [Candidatus Sigynarchaeota archaeon]